MNPNFFIPMYLAVVFILGDIFHDYLLYRRKRLISEEIEANETVAWLHTMKE